MTPVQDEWMFNTLFWITWSFVWFIRMGELKVKVSSISSWIVWTFVLLVMLHVNECIHVLAEPVWLVVFFIDDIIINSHCLSVKHLVLIVGAGDVRQVVLKWYIYIYINSFSSQPFSRNTDEVISIISFIRRRNSFTCFYDSVVNLKQNALHNTGLMWTWNTPVSSLKPLKVVFLMGMINKTSIISLLIYYR